MIAAACFIFAAYLFFGAAAIEKASAWLAENKTTLQPRHAAAVALLVVAAISLASRPAAPQPAPQPSPPPPDVFSLRGLFVGPTAAEDAAMLSGLCAALADCIEHDGTLAEPRLKTGVAMDDLRVAARVARLKGQSIGDRQPRVRDAVHKFLDDAVGASGGPVTAEGRAAWVSAFRDLANAAEEAAR